MGYFSLIVLEMQLAKGQSKYDAYDAVLVDNILQ